DGASKLRPSAAAVVTSRAVNPEPTDDDIHVWPLRGNVYLLTGDRGNIVVQIGDEGAFVVDSGTGRLADKTIAAIRRLSDRPVQFIANTSFRTDRTGGRSEERRVGKEGRGRGGAGGDRVKQKVSGRRRQVRTCRRTATE